VSEVSQSPSFAEVLAARRMCRDFLDRPIDPDVLDRVLRAAFRGPAAGNTDALDLLVLRGEHTAEYWEVTLPAAQREGFRWPGLLAAPVLVVPLVRADSYVERYAAPDKARTGLGTAQDAWGVPYWYIDGGAAVMALLLAAEADGLGALLFGQFDHEQAVASRFGVPSDRRALGTIALGHPAPGGRRPSASARRAPTDPASRIHVERW
jgi:nitroreductase